MDMKKGTARSLAGRWNPAVLGGGSWASGWSLWPGLVLTAAIALTGYWLSGAVVLFGPLIFAACIGIVIQNVAGTPVACRRGSEFAARILLRAAIALLGFQLTVSDLLSIGFAGLVALTALVAGSFAVTLVLGRLLKVEPPIARLLAMGTAICGASAIAAANIVVKGDRSDVAYSIGCITLLGTVLMIVLPSIAMALDLGPAQYGFWSGAALHEIAQTAGAGFAHSTEAGDKALMVKLGRVVLLAPMIVLLAQIAARGREVPDTGLLRSAFPPFIVLFVMAIIVGSMFEIPQDIREGLRVLSGFWMAMALAGLGLGTDLRRIMEKGLRPLALATLAAIILAAGAFAASHMVF